MCNLASLALNKFVTEDNPPKFNFKKLFEVTQVSGYSYEEVKKYKVILCLKNLTTIWLTITSLNFFCS